MCDLNTDNKKNEHAAKLNNLVNNAKAKVGVPILLYFLGVPGVFVVIIWFFFFRGK